LLDRVGCRCSVVGDTDKSNKVILTGIYFLGRGIQYCGTEQEGHMLYFKISSPPVTATFTGVSNITVSEEYPGNEAMQLRPRLWFNRNDFKHFEQAKAVAEQANACGGYKGSQLVAVDSGPNVSPRYDVIVLPKVGDPVSYAFNGDSYPDGTIVSVSASLKVVKTSTGRSYYRRRETGSWVNNGTWSLVAGHVYKQNPSF
jgi:hypothetical protein